MNFYVKNICMAGLIAQKKEDKRKRLLDAAYDLFVENGVSNTTISQICEKAGIAKGTFYLYFSSKEDILRALTKKMSLTIIEICYKNVSDLKISFVEKLVILADALLDLFLKDPDMLKVMKKDFVWPLSENDLFTTNIPVMIEIREAIDDYAKKAHINEHQILVRLYSMISMLCAVAYSSIFDHFPDDIDTLKPELFDMIRSVF